MRFIICDTRQQNDKHNKKHEQIIKSGICLLNACVPCGDYCEFDHLTEATKRMVTDLSFQYSVLSKVNRDLRKKVGEALLQEMKVSVDTKQNLDELSQNLMNSKDHSRFYKEIRLAYENRIKLYILCEHGEGVESIRDVSGWRSQYSRVPGRALMEKIYETHISYGTEFIFCDKAETGNRIIELLRGEKDAENRICESLQIPVRSSDMAGKAVL